MNWGGHLGDRVSGYADRTLAPAELLELDRHVTVCLSCRSAADDERRLLESLRRPVASTPPRSLEASLLALSRLLEDVSPAPTRAIRDAPCLPVVPVTAPAQHRSPLRAALVAGFAAGASAAAALSLVGAGTPAAGNGSPAPVVSRPAGAAGSGSPGWAGVSAGASAFGSAVAVRLGGSAVAVTSASAANVGLASWTVQRRAVTVRAQSVP